MIDYMKKPRYDKLYTPKYAIAPLLPYFKKFKNKIFWECTDFGKSNITKVLQKNGFKVITSHISEGKDFFKYQPKEWDILITNPPYSLKDKFLERAYSLNKPFCFLLPITTLEGIKRGKLFRRCGVELLVLDRRINFMKNKKACWFNTSWFCWKVLPEKLIFAELKFDNCPEGVVPEDVDSSVFKIIKEN